MFLLALFGIMWAVQAAVQYERVQTVLRYAWSLLQRTSPYTNYSFNVMYSQLGSTSLPTVSCTEPLTTQLSDGVPYASSSTVTASTSFWSPIGATRSCLLTGYLTYQPGNGQDVIVSIQEPQINAPVPVSSSFAKVIGQTSSASLTEFFYKQIGVDVVLACYPGLNSLEVASLNHAYPDTYSSATPTFSSVPSDIATHQAQTENTANFFPLSSNCL